MEAAIERVAEVIDDVDRAMDFYTQWSGGSVLGLEPGQRIDRWAATVRLSERAARDAEFRRELLRNPRYLSGLALRESSGIGLSNFLWQVNTVHILEEKPGLHWLVLPACHRGCRNGTVIESGLSTISCQACGKPSGRQAASLCDSTSPRPKTRLEGIHQVDDFVVRAVEADASSRERLVAGPTAFFAQACHQIAGAGPEEAFGIREVRVACDTDRMLYVVLLDVDGDSP